MQIEENTEGVRRLTTKALTTLSSQSFHGSFPLIHSNAFCRLSHVSFRRLMNPPTNSLSSLRRSEVRSHWLFVSSMGSMKIEER